MGLRRLDVEMQSFQALKDVGIEDTLFDVSPLSLSGGQKRRVAILLLDEPMAGLDPMGRKEILALLKKIHQEKKITVLFISHSMEDVADAAERVLVMHQGRIVLDGAPKKIFRYRKELEQIGLGVPQTVVLAEHLREQGWDFRGFPITPEEMIQEIALSLKGRRA